MAGLGGLSGLSAVYPGELAAQSQSQLNDLRQMEVDQAQAAIAGKQALGRVFQQLVPGAQPNMPAPPQQAAPQAPPPGQPSQPMRPPQPPPVAPPGPAAGGARGPQAALPPGAPPAGAQPSGPPGGGGMQGQFDLKTAAQAIAKANPGISPRVLVEALNQALPYLNAEAKQEVLQMRQQFQQENLNLREDMERERERHNQETEDRLRDAEKAKQDRFNTREARLQAKQEIQNDATVQRLALAQKALESRIANGDKNFTMKQWREVADAKRKAALAAASIYSVNNGLDDKQKAKLLKDVNDSAEEEIANMRNLQGSSTPTGGVPNPDGSKTSARAGDQPKPIPSDLRKQFDDALAAGADKAKSIQWLKDQGYKTDGL